jgi:hypothetical protein
MQLYGAGFVVFAMVFVVTCEPVCLAAETDAQHLTAAQRQAFCETKYLKNSCGSHLSDPRRNECSHDQILYDQCLRESHK